MERDPGEHHENETDDGGWHRGQQSDDSFWATPNGNMQVAKDLVYDRTH